MNHAQSRTSPQLVGDPVFHAKPVMTENGVAIDDLHAAVTPHLAEQAAAGIETALSAKK